MWLSSLFGDICGVIGKPRQEIIRSLFVRLRPVQRPVQLSPRRLCLARIRNQTTEANDETNYSDHPSFHVHLQMQSASERGVLRAATNHYRPQQLLRHSVTTL